MLNFRGTTLILFWLLLIPVDNLRSQDVFERPDTSEYLPLFINGALEYNLMIACEKGYAGEVERMVAAGAEIESYTEEYATPLVIAVANNHSDVTEILLKYSAEPDHFTIKGETPLLIAVKNGNPATTELLIRYGASINLSDQRGAGPLFYSALYGFYEIADILLYYEADEDMSARDGTTPLMAAIWAGYPDIARLLITFGANMEARDNDGFTPFLIASQSGDTATMNLLYRKGVNITETNNYGFDALGIAIRTNQEQSVENAIRLLKKEKINPSVITDPYKIAAVYRRNNIFRILEENKIPTNYRKHINQLSFSACSRFNSKDVSTGLLFEAKESLSGAGILAGIDTKLWYTRVYIKADENLYYQYRDKSTFVYGGLFKDIHLSDRVFGVNSIFYVSLSAGYSFGEKFPGTSLKPASKVKLLPSAGLKLEFEKIGFSAGAEYLNSGFDLSLPVWLRAGFYYKVAFDKINTPIKNIRWY